MRAMQAALAGALVGLTLAAVAPAWASSFQWGPASATQAGVINLVAQTLGAGIKTFPDAVYANGGIRVGSTGTTYTVITAYAPTLTPASVAANTTAEETFTVTGLASGRVIVNSPASLGTGLGIAGARAGTDQIIIRFINATAGALTPVSGVYPIVEWR